MLQGFGGADLNGLARDRLHDSIMQHLL